MIWIEVVCLAEHSTAQRSTAALLFNARLNLVCNVLNWSRVSC